MKMILESITLNKYKKIYTYTVYIYFFTCLCYAYVTFLNKWKQTNSSG